MSIVIGCEARTVELKEKIKACLQRKEMFVVDVASEADGSLPEEAVVQKVWQKIADRSCDRGIVVCSASISLAIDVGRILCVSSSGNEWNRYIETAVEHWSEIRFDETEMKRNEENVVRRIMEIKRQYAG